MPEHSARFAVVLPSQARALSRTSKGKDTSNKHPKTSQPSDADLRNDPGIGRSKGADRSDPGIGGDNTFEGDVLNDTTPEGGIDPNQRGRTNK